MIQAMTYPQEANEEATIWKRTVTFYCHAPNAKKVSLVGTFNDWDPEADPMERNSKGEWCVVLDLEPGDYEYQAVVDGRWLSEPVYTIPQAEPSRQRNLRRPVLGFPKQNGGGNRRNSRNGEKGQLTWRTFRSKV